MTLLASVNCKNALPEYVKFAKISIALCSVGYYSLSVRLHSHRRLAFACVNALLFAFSCSD